jgi:hypothetical protein
VSLVDTETGEVVVLMTEAEARKITAEIKTWAGTLWLKIEAAHRGQAWRALGYESWGTYLEAEFDISRSRGYQLVAHARAVRALAEAAGIEDESTMWTPREGHTRHLDAEAVAADVAERAADLPDDATDEDRAELVKVTVTEHYQNATKKGGDDGSDPAGDAPRGDGATGHDGGRTEPEPPSPTGPTSAPQGSDPSPIDLGERYPEDTYRINASKAKVRIGESLKVLDAERIAETTDVDGRADWLAFAERLHRAATEIETALSERPSLRSVQ